VLFPSIPTQDHSFAPIPLPVIALLRINDDGVVALTAKLQTQYREPRNGGHVAEIIGDRDLDIYGNQVLISVNPAREHIPGSAFCLYGS
jgi:hypothetical protein